MPSAPFPIPVRAAETGAPLEARDAPTRQRRREAPKGRRVDAAARQWVVSHLGPAVPARDRLIEALHGINDRLGHLPAPHLVALADWMKLPMAEVYEVASFYHHFDIAREGPDGALPEAPRLTVRVCDGLSCALAGGEALREQLAATLEAAGCGASAGVRVIAAPCIGRCEQAPAAVVNRRPVPRATPAELVQAVQAALADPAAGEDPGHCAIDLAVYRAGGGYALLQECHGGQRSVEAVIEALEASHLRGLGGAGFPAGRKWRIVRAQPAPRLVAVNLDEGEPGTFKDRQLLETDPHRFLEGLLIAAWAVQADAVYLYLRDEYAGGRAVLQRAIAELKAAALLPGLPVLDLRRGAGAYICGEESAMIESIEGRRGLPRLRPPYVAEVGLFGRPTLVHNAETLLWVRELVQGGAQAFVASGRHGRKGLRRYSVSGRVREPGVKLAPAGITLRELIEEHCGGLPEGHTLYGYLPGGASGGILPASLADLPLDFDTLQPHGAFIGSAAVVVLTTSATHTDRAVDVARNLMRFFEHESCGQCTPCRDGTTRARELIADDHWNRALLSDLAEVMRDASICGLGQAASNPFEHVMRYFAHELLPPPGVPADVLGASQPGEGAR